MIICMVLRMLTLVVDYSAGGHLKQKSFRQHNMRLIKPVLLLLSFIHFLVLEIATKVNINKVQNGL